jgi:hypothetical protein
VAGAAAAVETAEGDWCPSRWLGGEDIRILQIRLLDQSISLISYYTSRNHKSDLQVVPGSSSWSRAQDRAPSRFWVLAVMVPSVRIRSRRALRRAFFEVVWWCV